MRKKTSTILGLAIATILTAYILTLTMSNKAFAQETGDNHLNQGGLSNQLGQPASNPGQLGHTLTKLAGQATKSALGDVCLSCWGGLAAHETQQVNKVLSGELGHLGLSALGQQGQTNGGTGSGSTLGSTAPSGVTAGEFMIKNLPGVTGIGCQGFPELGGITSECEAAVG